MYYLIYPQQEFHFSRILSEDAGAAELRGDKTEPIRRRRR